MSNLSGDQNATNRIADYQPANKRTLGCTGNDIKSISLPSGQMKAGIITFDGAERWQQKFQATQGVRGALVNLWRQIVK